MGKRRTALLALSICTAFGLAGCQGAPEESPETAALPEPAEFLGGADHLGPGATSYFRVDLTPGRYAFVSEGFAASHGMVHEFTVE